MQKWEYRSFARCCGLASDPNNATNVWSKSVAWSMRVDDELAEMGLQGWELVSICERPNEELWVFKRPIE